MITAVTAFLILFGSPVVVSAFKVTAGRADLSSTPHREPMRLDGGAEPRKTYRGLREEGNRTGAGELAKSVTTLEAGSPDYWRALAVKRLAGWRHAELQRNHARGQLRKLRRALRASVRLGASGLERGFLCIHSFEGSWTDPNPPHYGGLQFDDSFQRTYGPEFYRAYGTANHWTPAMQMAAAMRAYLSGRGYSPWPNTRKSCGL